jgi:transposase
MLYLLASGQAHTRQEVAQRLGVQRHIIGHWLVRYEAGGLDALLALYVPAGKPLSLPPDVLDALEQVLRQPAGVASSVDGVSGSTKPSTWTSTITPSPPSSGRD